jgi:cysteinyl-tRNA synthetase
MSKRHLGDTIDLHTGGIDLLFPHHENEIAQSQCCNGAALARHWYHSEHLLVDGATMSKSKGNYYTLGDLTAKGYAPEAVRYALLAGHPRKQLNFTLESLHAAESALSTLREFRGRLSAAAAGAAAPPSPLFDRVLACLADDLNLPSALGELFTEVQRGAAGSGAAAAGDLAAFDRMRFALGFTLEAPKAEAPAPVAALAERRWAARRSRDFGSADALRREIAAAGWSMLDGKDGYRLEPLRKP